MSSLDVNVHLIATRELESTISAKQTIVEEHSASFKWLMASMLAINAGGLIKLGDFADIPPTAQLVAAIAFLIGILGALAIAWLGQMASRAMLEPLSELGSFWTMVAATGEYDEEIHQSILSKVKSAIGKGKRSRIAGWISIVAFVVGVVSILSNQPTQQRSEKAAAMAPTETAAPVQVERE